MVMFTLKTPLVSEILIETSFHNHCRDYSGEIFVASTTIMPPASFLQPVRRIVATRLRSYRLAHRLFPCTAGLASGSSQSRHRHLNCIFQPRFHSLLLSTVSLTSPVPRTIMRVERSTHSTQDSASMSAPPTRGKPAKRIMALFVKRRPNNHFYAVMTRANVSLPSRSMIKRR
jgi:hypothetical protein